MTEPFTQSDSRPMLAAQFAALIVNVAEQKGVDRSELFSLLQLDPERLSDTDQLLSYNEIFSLIHAALNLCPTPGLGLDVGRAQTVGSWGVLGYALMSCANEIEAARIGAQYYQAAPALLQFTSDLDGERQRFKVDPIFSRPQLLPFCVEVTFTGICTVASEYLVEPLVPQEMWLTYPRPNYANMYDEVFGCPIKYNAPYNAFWSRAPTERALRAADPVSAALCLKLVELLVERHRKEDGFILELRRLLMKNPGNMPGLSQISVELAMSPRTLRRRLAGLGTSFRGVQDDVRKNLAQDYLQSARFSVQQTAHLLGYTEQTNFRRAFKRWTGRNPSDLLEKKTS